jgi:hypothetical protein
MEVDVATTHVLARRLNVPGTAAIVAVSAVGATATVLAIILVVVANSRRPVPFE